MDLGQVLSVLQLKWDLPWRLFASLVGIATVASIWFGGSALLFLSQASTWIGVDRPIVNAFVDVHTWLAAHSLLFGTAGLLLEFISLVFAGAPGHSRSESRAPATVLVGASLAIECTWPIPAACVYAAAVLLWAIALIVRVVYVHRSTGALAWDNEVFLAEERLRRTWFAPLVSLFYFPLVPMAWAVRA